MLPIPGTSKVDHLESNTAAAFVELDDSTMQELEQSATRPEIPRVEIAQMTQRVGFVCEFPVFHWQW